MVQGALEVWVRLIISYFWRVNSSQRSWAWASISDSFHWRRGSVLRRSKRRACSSLVTLK